MRILKPSIGKILTTPFITFLLIIGIFNIIGNYFSNIVPEDLSWFINLLILVICIIAGYYISCSIWEYGENHRRVRIIIITLLISLSSFLILSLALSFFSLCLTDMGLPCVPDQQCNPPQPCHQTLQMKILSEISIGIPALVLLIGAMFFRRASKITTKINQK